MTRCAPLSLPPQSASPPGSHRTGDGGAGVVVVVLYAVTSFLDSLAAKKFKSFVADLEGNIFDGAELSLEWDVFSLAKFEAGRK